MNNKAIQKLMMALAVCGALCGTTFAAPKGNPPPKGKAPTAMKALAQKSRAAKAPAPAKKTAKAPARATVNVRPAPARNTTKHEVVRHAQPPPARQYERHHEPRHEHHRHDHRCHDSHCRDRHHDHRCHDPHCHHGDTLHTEDWCEIGASLLGGLVGGLIGASI